MCVGIYSVSRLNLDFGFFPNSKIESSLDEMHTHYVNLCLVTFELIMDMR